MLSMERQEIILNLLKERKKVTILELSKHLNVTLNTIRSDVALLEKDGVIIRIHGGVALPASNINASNSSIGTRYLKNLTEKRVIAKQVVGNLPRDRDVSIFMDSSTSTLEVALALAPLSIRCTVITHFSNIALILGLNPHITVVFCGGEWWSNENCTVGVETIEALHRYHADIALIGCTAIQMEQGISNGNIETVPVKQKMISNATQTWLLCDSSKFDEDSLLKIANFSQIHRIYTDQKPSDEWMDFSYSSNFNIIYPV